MAENPFLYLRQAELIVGPKSTVTNATVEPTTGRLFRGRILFSIEKTSVGNPNQGKISIFNINQESRNFLEQDNLIVFLKAGYRDALATLFFGEVIRRESQRSGGDVMTSLECGDAEKLLTRAHVEISLGPGATNVQVFDRAAAALNLSLKVRKGIEVKTFFQGFTFSGLVKDLLDEQTEKIGIEWNVQDGELQILPLDESTGETAVLLTPNTGLIGWPTKDVEGLKFLSLLNPELRPGRAAKVVSKQFQGAFGKDAQKAGSTTLIESGDVVKLTKVTHEGDSQSGPWHSRCEAVRIPNG